MNRFRKHRTSWAKKGPSKCEDIRALWVVDREPLTDELIACLVGQGWLKSQLLFARNLGASYSRSNNAVLFPMIPGTHMGRAIFGPKNCVSERG